ncbi:probable DNA polymerase III [Candidatus Pelagibacter sp. HTCC7211]|uniref:AAA family ATPase n=1 Tax=Pelagibacter sp. (strain HTCC7211) TaxID=439493 RepID=UPI000183BA96|nr:AAA family ATPase [Candidatus Pelagibacter sp. HTCC7211]EDZ60947.1 probable DNA polymerase III [Candidatus Pelagibacter sp. HTCC7211]
MKLEPANQIRLFSHKKKFESLINLYSKNKLPNKILFSGEKGIGKCTLAYHMVNYILSLSEENPYDTKNLQINSENKSFKLVQNKSSPNFILIDVSADKKNIDIDQIRNLILSLNKSSFNDKPRIVLIDNIELLNLNSVNALLKILEEPNDNINFILINNNKKILPTLKSRCLNFKIQLNFEQSIDTINKILDNNIYDLLNINLINYYNTPRQLLNLINLQNQFDLNLKEMNLKDLIFFIIKNKHYKKDLIINELIYSLIEFYLRSKISVDDISLINIKDYFLKKINDTKKFNLDEEALLMEFEDKVFNG